MATTLNGTIARLAVCAALAGVAGFTDGCARPRPSAVDVEYIPLEGRPELPFSAAVRVGSTLYLSGQIGTDRSGKLVPGGIAAETRQTLENIREVLEANGSSLDHVIKCTAMLLDMSEWAAMNKVYAGYFTEHLPARSAFGATGFALGARIELECWATVEEKTPRPSSQAASSAEPQPTVTLPPPLARVLADYESAWRKKDAAALATLFAEDGFVLSNGAPPVRGREAIERRYTGSGGPLSLRALAYATEGSSGYIIGGFARHEGEPDVGKFTLTLRKGTDDQWLIVSDMDNGNSWP